MSKKIALAAALAFATAGVVATAGSADAGSRHHRHHHHHHHNHHSHYKPYVYSYNYYRPAYVYRSYQPVCSAYGWVWKHGYKVWGCIW